MHLLYIDDDRVNALLFAEMCRLVPGVRVETASSGSEAMELVGDAVAPLRPDLLVIDLHLGDTDGVSLLPQLRAALAAPVPALLCSADTADAVDARARAAGFDGWLTKPIELGALMARIAVHRPPTSAALPDA